MGGIKQIKRQLKLQITHFKNTPLLQTFLFYINRKDLGEASSEKSSRVLFLGGEKGRKSY